MEELKYTKEELLKAYANVTVRYKVSRELALEAATQSQRDTHFEYAMDYKKRAEEILDLIKKEDSNV